MKIYILMDCSIETGSNVTVGNPVGVYTSLDKLLHDADMRSWDYGYDITFDHYIVEMELGKGYAVDEAIWLTLDEARHWKVSYEENYA